MVEDEAEAIELLLLRRHRACRRLSGIFLQCAVHPFVSSVLLRPSRLNALVNDAELHPALVQIARVGEMEAIERFA
jgi:hypothetical protein